MAWYGDTFDDDDDNDENNAFFMVIYNNDNDDKISNEYMTSFSSYASSKIDGMTI